MPEHMRPDLERQPGALPYLLKQVVDGLTRHRAALAYEEMRQMSKLRLLADPEPGADRAQLVSFEGMFRAQATLQPAHKKPGGFQVQFFQSDVDQL